MSHTVATLVQTQMHLKTEYEHTQSTLRLYSGGN